MIKPIKFNKRKTSGKDIVKYYGILKGDKEYSKIMKDIKKAWNALTKKYLNK